MSTDRDLLPLYERQAARAAIEQLVHRHGSQAAAGAQLGVSQNAVNKAMLYTKIGPSVMRLLLAHLGLDLPELLRRHGDPALAPPDAPAQRTLTPKEDAIITAARFTGAPEREIRAIAAEYDTILANAKPIEWLDTLLRSVQHRILTPQREERGVARKKRSEQRALRTLHEAARAESTTPIGPTATTAKKRAAR